MKMTQGSFVAKEMKEKNMHPACWADGIYDKVVDSDVREKSKLVELNSDTYALVNSGYEHFIFVTEKSGFNISGAIDDLALITESLADTKELSFAQSNSKSWFCGNLAHLGAFRFTVTMVANEAEIDANELAKIKAIIVKKMRELGVQIDLNFAKGYIKVFTRFQLGKDAVTHIKNVVDASRAVLDEIQNSQETQNLVKGVSAPMAKLFKELGAGGGSKEETFKKVGEKALEQGLVAVDDLVSRIPDGMDANPDWDAIADDLAARI